MLVQECTSSSHTFSCYAFSQTRRLLPPRRYHLLVSVLDLRSSSRFAKLYKVSQQLCLRYFVILPHDSSPVSIQTQSLAWQAANHGCHCFDRSLLLAGACVCCVKISRNKRNAIVDGKVGENASEVVILELIRSKCIPILICGLECLLCFALTKSDLRSLDFAVNRFLMKIFRSNNSEIIAECRRYFQSK